MRQRTLSYLCLFISLWAMAPAAGGEAGGSVGQARRAGSGQELGAIETRLLDLTNAERAARGLGPLRLSADLVGAARRHSQDMAAHGVLSHLSSSGRPFEDRLVAAGVYFAGAGENVAVSSEPSAERINESLMDSPGHRENILNPGYDLVGIAAAESASGDFFVTEDFTVRLAPLSSEEAVRQAALVVRDIRRQRGVTAIMRDVRADAVAQKLADKRAAGGAIGRVPASFGEVYVLLVESGFFRDLDRYADAIGNGLYSSAGFGVAFGRTRENPGGVYIMVLILQAGR